MLIYDTDNKIDKGYKHTQGQKYHDECIYLYERTHIYIYRQAKRDEE